MDREDVSVRDLLTGHWTRPAGVRVQKVQKVQKVQRVVVAADAAIFKVSVTGFTFIVI